MTINAGPTDALIIVDVQNDFCEGGVFDLQGGNAIVAPINALARQFHTVVATQDFHPTGHSSFASSHEGGEPFTEIDMPYGRQTLGRIIVCRAHGARSFIRTSTWMRRN